MMAERGLPLELPPGAGAGPNCSGVPGFLPTRVGQLYDWLVKWSRKNSLWPMPFGTACCAIEMMSALASRFDMSRFGAEVIRFSPRQADLLIVSGRVSLKMLPVLLQIYNQMPEPKWVIAMGACASTGGVFDTYTLIQGVDRFLPVDVYLPGCPPRPETLIDGLLEIQRRIDRGERQTRLFDPATHPLEGRPVNL